MALAPSLPDLSKIKNVRHANEPAIKHLSEIGLSFSEFEAQS